MFSRKIPFNVWLHVTATWDQRFKLAKIFINGTIGARKLAADGKSSYVLRNNSHSLYQIGNKKDGGKTFYGLVTKLKVFKKVLSSQDISTEMSGMLFCFLKGALSPTFGVTINSQKTYLIQWNR